MKRASMAGRWRLLVTLLVGSLVVACGNSDLDGGNGGIDPDPNGDRDQPPRLEEGEWTLVGYVHDGVPGSPLDETPVTALFTRDAGAESGHISGSAGCNAYSGVYIAEDGSVRFSELASTDAACAPQIMTHEEAYFAILAVVSDYETTTTRLTMSEESGLFSAVLLR
jgi:heat shock protein HslJ